MANGWGNNEKSDILYFLGLQNHCSHEIKRRVLLGRKAMTNLDSVLKSKDITSVTKIHLVKAMVFPVVMYGCESWIIKKTEHWRIDAFKLWCWRRHLKVPGQQRDQSSQYKRKWTLNIQWKDWCWSWSSKTLATWLKSWLIGKDPDAGKAWRQKKGGCRGWDG